MTDAEALPAAAGPGYLTEALRRSGALRDGRVEVESSCGTKAAHGTRVVWCNRHAQDFEMRTLAELPELFAP
ncbi:MAG TPA: hypothetical protein VGG57_23060 [Stellaceae bacterium]|jgi:hypothetical protein